MYILPIDAKLVRRELAERVVVPSFDALSREERQVLRDREPLTFLHAMHTPGPGAVARSREGLERLLAEGVFGPSVTGAVFGYRLAEGGRSETALLCAIPAGRFADGGDVLSHEDTQPEMVGHLAHYLRELGVASSPVKTAFPANDRVAELLADICAGPPSLSTGDADGLVQELWPVTDPSTVAEVTAAFAEVDRAYITDGHHRSAAALEVGPETPVLVALFPDDDLRIVQFNRVVAPLGPYQTEALHTWLRDAGATEVDGCPQHVEAGTVGVHLEGRWWTVALPRTQAEPPDSLDPAVLQEAVLGPLLSVRDPATDARLSFVPGAVPLGSLADRATAAGGVGFALAPVTMADVMAVADRGASMPPKSTYFEPKPRSGLLLMHL